MPIQNLTIIGESLNDSIPSTHRLYEANDIEGIKSLAKSQDEKGAAYIDVNIGPRSPEFMADLVRLLQSVTNKPLSLDTPDYELAKAGLEAYDLDKAGGKLPILNSITPLRTTMFDLFQITPFLPILLVYERMENGAAKTNETADQVYQTAKEMITLIKTGYRDIPLENCIFDVGIAPLASDFNGMTKRTLEAIKLIGSDPILEKCHLSLGLSNFTVMLPSRRKSGGPVKSTLESAFLTKAIPLGLDMIIGSVKRNYQFLPPDHPAMQCLEDILKLSGYDIITRVQAFYNS